MRPSTQARTGCVTAWRPGLPSPAPAPTGGPTLSIRWTQHSAIRDAFRVSSGLKFGTPLSTEALTTALHTPLHSTCTACTAGACSAPPLASLRVNCLASRPERHHGICSCVGGSLRGIGFTYATICSTSTVGHLCRWPGWRQRGHERRLTESNHGGRACCAQAHRGWRDEIEPVRCLSSPCMWFTESPLVMCNFALPQRVGWMNACCGVVWAVHTSQPEVASITRHAV